RRHCVRVSRSADSLLIEMDEREDLPHKHEPALDTSGTPPVPPVARRSDDAIHISPELAVAEGDVRSAELDRDVHGSSLWRDARRRLFQNKLAVFGLVVVSVIAIASIA